MPTSIVPIIMMSNVDPRYLRTCQPTRNKEEDDILLKMEIGYEIVRHEQKKGSPSDYPRKAVKKKRIPHYGGSK